MITGQSPYNIPTTGADPSTNVKFTIMAARALTQQELAKYWLTYLQSKDGRKLMRGAAKRRRTNTWTSVTVMTCIS